MAIKGKNNSTKKPELLEGFTYEELPSNDKVNIPSEIIDNSVIVNIDDAKAESKLEEGVKEIDLKIELPDTEDNGDGIQAKKKSVIEFELPEVKEKSKVMSKRRNSSRKIIIGGSSLNLDKVELPEAITIDYKIYSGVIKEYMFKAFLLQLMAILRDTAELTNEEMVEHLRTQFPQILRLIIGKILDEHKMLEDIIVSFQAFLDEEAPEDDQQIIIALETIIKFPEHVKTYEAKDFVVIPA